MAIQVKRAMLDVSKYQWKAGEGDDKKSVAHHRIMSAAVRDMK